MSHHFTLRFDSEAQALATAEAMRLLPDGDEQLPETLVCDSPNLFGQAQLITDVVVPGTYDENGDEVTPPVPVPGVFVNLVLSRAVLPPALRRYRVAYGSGGRVFAGTEPEAGAWPPET